MKKQWSVNSFRDPVTHTPLKGYATGQSHDIMRIIILEPIKVIDGRKTEKKSLYLRTYTVYIHEWGGEEKIPINGYRKSQPAIV